MKTKNRPLHLQLAIALLFGMTASGISIADDPPVRADDTPTVQATSAIEAGRYLVTVGGCNDCHTAGWMPSNGNVPESDWLTGSPVGFRGPWGTSYPSNLRLLAQEIDEDTWVFTFRERTGLPPMPWMNLKRISEQDARAMYQFIRSLGNGGTRMPAAVAPGVEPQTPYFEFEPKHMERLQAPSAATGT